MINNKIYVSPYGKDNAAGDIETPLKSLSKALEKVNKLQSLQKRDCFIILREGEYLQDETLVIGPQHADADSSLSISAQAEEKVVLTSAHPVKGWELAEHSDIPKALKGKVWSCDMSQHAGYTGDFRVLYNNGMMLKRARSKGFIIPMEPLGGRKFFDRQLLNIPKDFLHMFLTGSPEIFCRPHQSWLVNYLDIESVDKVNSTAKTAVSATYRLDAIGNMREEENCWVENVLPAMAEEGDWVLDKTTDTLYLCCYSDPSSTHISFPRLTEMVRLAGNNVGENTQALENVAINGIVFQGGDRDVWTKEDSGIQHDWDIYDKGNALIRLRGAKNCRIENCELRNSGSGGIRLDLYAQNNKISGNKLRDLGGTGILLCGYGPGKKDFNRFNEVHNNDIARVGRLFWHAPGIFIWQSGENKITNNRISDLHYNGIVLSGIRPRFFKIKDPDEWKTNFNMPEDLREYHNLINYKETGLISSREQALSYATANGNLVQDNEIFRVVQTLDDGNAIYLSCAGPDNIIRRNFIYSCPRVCSEIRFDDDQEDSTVEQNVIFGNGIKLKHTNHILNNIIIGGTIIFFRSAQAGSRVEKNIIYSTYNPEFLYCQDPELLSRIKPNHNCIYSNDPETIQQTFEELTKDSEAGEGSIVADPGFKNLPGGDLSMTAKAPALKVGFKPIDYQQIGLTHNSAFSRLAKNLQFEKKAVKYFVE